MAGEREGNIRAKIRAESPLFIDKPPYIRPLVPSDYPSVRDIIFANYNKVASPILNMDLTLYAQQLLSPIDNYLEEPNAKDTLYAVSVAHIEGRPKQEETIVGVVGFTGRIDPDLYTYALEHNDLVPGLATALTNGTVGESRSIYTALGLAHREDLPYVSVGRGLLSYIENIALQNGKTYVLFFSNRAWQKAQELYTHRGYIQLGEMEHFPPGYAYAMPLTSLATNTR